MGVAKFCVVLLVFVDILLVIAFSAPPTASTIPSMEVGAGTLFMVVWIVWLLRMVVILIAISAHVVVLVSSATVASVQCIRSKVLDLSVYIRTIGPACGRTCF